MTSSDRERRGLAEALGLLGAGASSAFEYHLWVVFGDRWTSVRASLSAEGAIRPAPGAEWRLTESGQRLREALEEEAQAPSGST